ncbi:MAG: hypothetical protein AAF721_26455 [Myxococcota bacterium]
MRTANARAVTRHEARLWAAIASCGGLLWTGLSPQLAAAGNGAEPRVPPAFLGGACLETLRAGDAPLHLTIGIPVEELQATSDEPPGTRSFQFFALCRELYPGEALPPWVYAADVADAQAANPEILTPGDELVLPTSSWASCVVPITPTESRMPITCPGTAEGVDLAADALPPGNHVLYGYTYEPAKNIWTPRTGVVRVVGDEGEAALPPAVAFSYPVSDLVASVGMGVTLTGCATGKAGTTVDFAWATASDLVAFGDDAWESFDSIELGAAAGDGGLDDDGGFAVPFAPPPGSEYKVAVFRALATDPDGGTWVAYTRANAVLEPGCAEPEDGTELVADLCGVGVDAPEPTDVGAGMPARDECEEPVDAASTDGDGGEGTGSTGGGSSESGAAAPDAAGSDDGGGGCACNAGPSGRGSPWLFAACAGLLGARRRRRSNE